MSPQQSGRDPSVSVTPLVRQLTRGQDLSGEAPVVGVGGEGHHPAGDAGG
jgi:hypothetical protein